MRSKVLIGGFAAVMAFLLATSSLAAQAAAFISSADIINNTIKSGDVKNNSLKGKDIKDNKLTGADINEATLGTVPNATNLNGQPASTYLTNARTLTPTLAAPTTAALWPVALPAGQYLVNWQVYLDTANNTGQVICGLYHAAAGEYAAVSQIDVNAVTIQALSGGGTVTLTGPTQYQFFCSSFGGAGAMSMAGPQSIEVTFQQLASNPVTTVPGRPSSSSDRPGTN